MRSTGLDECNYKILIATIFASIITGCAMPVAEGLPPAKPRIQYVSRTSYQCIPDPTTNSTECEGIFNFPPATYISGGAARLLSLELGRRLYRIPRQKRRITGPSTG
jgi:hypothetical protein